MDNMTSYNSKRDSIMVDMYSHYTNKEIESWELIPYISDKTTTPILSFYFNKDKRIRAGFYNREKGCWNPDIILKTDSIVYYPQNRSSLISYRERGIIDGIPIKELVDKEIIQPFLLFLGGQFVWWSRITLYKDRISTYLVITPNINEKEGEYQGGGIDPDDILDETDDQYSSLRTYEYEEDKTSATTILNLPINKGVLFYSEIGEHMEDPFEAGGEPIPSPWTLIFGFDENGKLDVSGKCRIYMNRDVCSWGYVQLRLPDKLIQNEDTGEYINVPQTIFEDDVQVPDECLLYKSNVFLFYNNMIYTKAKVDISQYNTLIVDDGKRGFLEYKVFYDKRSQKPYNNVSQIPNHEFLRHYYLNVEPKPEWLSILHKLFDFDLDSDKTFDENMVEFYKYLEQYNYRTLIDKIKSKRVIVYGGYVGHMDKETRPRRLLMFPKEWESTTIGYMLFINGMLSNAYVLEETTYGIYVDFTAYSDNSYYEMVVMDNKGGNMTYTTTNPDQDTYFTVKDNTSVYEYYCDTHPDQLFDTLDQMKDHVQYRIPNEYYREDENGVTILNDFYLQNKTIYRVPLDRIAQDSMVVNTDDFFEWHLDPEKFKYCTDKTRYLVFVNGLRLSSSLYRVIVPDPSTPFDDQAIYFNIWLNKGDSVYVCYTFLNMIDEVYIDRISGSDTNKSGVDTLGYITGPKDYPVPLSKYLQFYFVNGIKIPEAYLMDISYNTIRLTVNMKTIENLSIVGIDSELIDFFAGLNLPHSYIDQVFEMNSKNDINIMTNTYTSITDTQKPRKKEIDDHAMINEIVRHYYGHVNKGVPFKYVYDDHVYAEVDRDGNVIIDVMDATREVNLLPDEDDPIRKEEDDNGSEQQG